MRTRIHACFAVLVFAACGGPSEEERQQAERVWEVSHTELHTMHGETVRMAEEFDTEYTYACPDGGRIDMVVTYEGQPSRATIRALVHEYFECATGGLVLNGTLDYLEFSLCENGTPNFQVLGDLVVSGELDLECELSGTETCGSLEGSACGVTVR